MVAHAQTVTSVSADETGALLAPPTLSAPAWILSGNGSTDTVSASTPGLGWENNRLTLRSPSAGAPLQIYDTGSPAEPTLYWPGRLVAGSISNVGGSIPSDQLSGSIPIGIMQASMPPPLYDYQEGDGLASTRGVTYTIDTDYIDDGVVREPTGGPYWHKAEVQTGGTTSLNTLRGRYRTTAQLCADIMPSATAVVDFPSILPGGTRNMQVTVPGAVYLQVQSVVLGWNQPLITGLVVSQALVTGDNTVTIYLSNIKTGSAIDPGPMTVRVSVILH